MHREIRSFAAAATLAVLTSAGAARAHDEGEGRERVKVEMFAPARGDRVGVGGAGWFIDLAIGFEAGLEQTGFSGFQVTGPGIHDDAPPFPGRFSLGADDRLPGLVVLVSTTSVGARSCQNLANLFNLTGVTDRTEASTELWDTWIVGAPNFGVGTESVALAAIVADHDRDGVYDDAPGTIPDANGDGSCDVRDLRAFGLASNVAKARFTINP